MNNNINGFELPIWIECNNDYSVKLKEMFDTYISSIDTPAFRHEEGLISEIKDICDDVFACYVEYTLNSNNALKMMRNILQKYYDNEFLVSELGKSYALRGISPFYELHHSGYDGIYELMLNTPLDLYRIRSTEKSDDISDYKDMLHIPYSKRKYASNQRFSLKECPCLYLGTSSYDCWVECRNPEFETVYISGFRPNDEGEKLRIINLAISEGLINGMYTKMQDEYFSPEHDLQNEMMKIFPLVIATSFTIRDNSKSREKVEYIISHLIMEVLKSCNVDGVAYLSKRVEADIQYPCAVNLAFPVYDINDCKEYGKICDCFKVTKPKKITDLSKEETDSKNYISTVYSEKYTEPSLKNYEDMHKIFVKCDNRITDFY